MTGSVRGALSNERPYRDREMLHQRNIWRGRAFAHPTTLQCHQYCGRDLQQFRRCKLWGKGFSFLATEEIAPAPP